MDGYIIGILYIYVGLTRDVVRVNPSIHTYVRTYILIRGDHVFLLVSTMWFLLVSVGGAMVRLCSSTLTQPATSKSNFDLVINTYVRTHVHTFSLAATMCFSFFQLEGRRHVCARTPRPIHPYIHTYVRIYNINPRRPCVYPCLTMRFSLFQLEGRWYVCARTLRPFRRHRDQRRRGRPLRRLAR